MATEKTKSKIIDALLGLLSEKPYAEIGLGEVAARAGLSLGDLRAAYDGKLAVLADFMRHIDSAVLDAADEPSTDESARDRLFDLIMKRLDRMAPHRAAVGHLAESARRDPGLALCLNRIALDSARFMLAGAGISTDGLRGAARTQGFVLMVARILPVWRKDEDPDLSKTMAAVDRALEHAESWSRRTDRAARILCRVGRKLDRHRPKRSAKPEAEAPPAA
ncbi:MAG: TetR/AcrR family transcriptional regulator [Candidatus Kaistia colombiensis]|nr:MAG: TetR/AcrR family transcriptional regulator [Kaistia sp.]